VSIAKLVIKLRKDRGWSQYVVADKAGIPRGTIASIEIERSIPKTDILLKLAAVFERPVEDFYRAAGFVSEAKGEYEYKDTPNNLLQ